MGVDTLFASPILFLNLGIASISYALVRIKKVAFSLYIMVEEFKNGAVFMGSDDSDESGGLNDDPKDTDDDLDLDDDDDADEEEEGMVE